MAEFSLFNALGEVRSDFTDEEIAAVSPERQELWGALIAANTTMQDAEAEQREATVQIDKRVAGLRAAELALGEARPKRNLRTGSEGRGGCPSQNYSRILVTA